MLDASLWVLVFLVPILLAYSTIRYDQRMNRRQRAADQLSEWADDVGILASDAVDEWHRWRADPTDDSYGPRKYADRERRLRLRYARLRRRIPSDLVEVIDPPAYDLQLLSVIALQQFPRQHIDKAHWKSEPLPPGILDAIRPDHGEWLSSRVLAIVEPLEAYVSRGRLPGSRWRQVKPSRLFGWDYVTDDPPLVKLEDALS